MRNYDLSKTGAELISDERDRQIVEEKWSPKHDDEHTDGSLALAAICYATPVKLYKKVEYGAGPMFCDPWPGSWRMYFDKRWSIGKGGHGTVIPEPSTYTDEERFDFLVKAGALIAAELDRLIRRKKKNGSKRGNL